MRNFQRGKSPTYRHLEDLAACYVLRRMGNKDVAVINVTSESRRIYLVSTLDDVAELGVDVKFPEDLKAKYDFQTVVHM